jgi:hypothetical protein
MLKKTIFFSAIIIFIACIYYYFPVFLGFEYYEQTIRSSESTESRILNNISKLRFFEQPETVQLILEIIKNDKYSYDDKTNAVGVISGFEPSQFQTDLQANVCNQICKKYEQIVSKIEGQPPFGKKVIKMAPEYSFANNLYFSRKLWCSNIIEFTPKSPF